MHILLVVGDHLIRKTEIKEALANRMHVTFCSDEKSAFNVVGIRQPDIIIVDEMLLGESAISFCRKLKDNNQTSHAFVVLITESWDSMHWGVLAGADFCVPIPFHIELLPSIIKNLEQTRGRLMQFLNNRFNANKPDVGLAATTDEIIMKKLIMSINGKLSDPTLNVEALSKDIGVSSNFLYRRVKKITGHTVIDFIRNHRVSVGAKLLLMDGARVGEVGYQVGFNSPSYFSHRFKEIYGCTPREFTTKQHFNNQRGKSILQIVNANSDIDVFD